MALLSSFGKQGVDLGLLTRKVDIEDREHLSKYFAVVEFNSIFTAGKNSLSFNGSALLKNGSEIMVECLDSNGQSLYLEQAKSADAQFTDSAKFVISIHVYNETYNGAGKVVIVGTSVNNEVVRWIGNITIDKTLDNTSKVRFYNKPTIEARSLLYPVVDTTLAKVEYPPPPAARNATAHVASMQHTLQNIVITNQGSDYTYANVTIGGPGSGATATAYISAGQIYSIVVVNHGSGYVTAPSITITGDGTGATAYGNTLNKIVTPGGITIDDGGVGYTTNPVVTISGVGSGAAASAFVTNGIVTSIIVTNGGTGYTSTPLITIAPPPAAALTELNVPVGFSASFFTLAATPVKDTPKGTLNLKQTDVDYRLIITSSVWNPLGESDFTSSTYPIKVFNTQMEGMPITLHISKVQVPHSNRIDSTHLTASFTIKKVLDTRTIQLDEPYFYASNSNNIFNRGRYQMVSNIVQGRCFVNYRLILYNTNPDSFKQLTVDGEQIDVKASYAEIIYRNLKPYSGYVARHKIYRKSSFAPGDFQLISDELLPSPELLTDTITFNKFYDRMGVFYHNAHIEKYWWPSSASLDLQAVAIPINSMRIWRGDDPSLATGNEYVLLKTDSIGTFNDNIYYPYNSAEYNRLSGSSYNSNFISLKKDTLYVLSTNISLEKLVNDSDAKVSFYFTSSIATIRTEKTFDPKYGMKLGEIATKDKVRVKYFQGAQQLFFTPVNDYFGTLVVVPYYCNPTLSDISLKAYGDYGFSPDSLVISIPFDIQAANEAFDIKAELFDRNSNVVYSNLRTVQTFDGSGESMYNNNSANSVTNVITVDGGTTIISGEPYFPGLTQCDTTTRLVGWHIPTGDTTTDGKLCYTNVARLYISSSDYIALHDYQSGVEVMGKAIAVQYNFAQNTGRKIFIDAVGAKTTYP